jgi:hypothetical protein
MIYIAIDKIRSLMSAHTKSSAAASRVRSVPASATIQTRQNLISSLFMSFRSFLRISKSET